MSITRKKVSEALSGIEITDDAMKALMDMIHGEVDGLKDANDDLMKQLEAAKAESTAAAEARTNAEKALTDYKAEQTAKETKAAREGAYRALLKEAGVADKFLNLIMKGTDLSGVEIGADGKLTDAGKLTEAIKAEHADFIENVNKAGTSAENPPAGGSGGVDLGSMSMAEYIAARKKN